MKRLGILLLFLVLTMAVFADGPTGSPPAIGSEEESDTSEGTLGDSLPENPTFPGTTVSNLCGNGVCERDELTSESCPEDCDYSLNADENADVDSNDVQTVDSSYNPLLDYEDSANNNSNFNNSTVNNSENVNSGVSQTNKTVDEASTILNQLILSAQEEARSQSEIVIPEFDYDRIITAIQRNRYVPPEEEPDNTTNILMILVVILLVFSSIQITLNVLLLKKISAPVVREETDSQVYNPINKSLKKYIKQNLKNFDYDTIKFSLMEEGFTAEEIDEIYVEIQGEV